MKKEKLIQAIITEMERVWGSYGFDGDSDDYRWLVQNYGITEEEDVRWQLILEYEADELSEEDWDDDELIAFLEDQKAVTQFLALLLSKYQSSSVIYLKQHPSIR